jgi:4-carboxymuconolactone decarboxylase
MSRFDELPETRRRGLEKMEEVYGFQMNDMEGDFFGYTVDHLFADIWNRPGLTNRDRRLLLIGMLSSHGAQDVLTIQIPAAFQAGELDATALREVVIMVGHYAGWPVAARMDRIVEDTIARGRGDERTPA